MYDAFRNQMYDVFRNGQIFFMLLAFFNGGKLMRVVFYKDHTGSISSP